MDTLPDLPALLELAIDDIACCIGDPVPPGQCAHMFKEALYNAAVSAVSSGGCCSDEGRVVNVPGYRYSDAEINEVIDKAEDYLEDLGISSLVLDLQQTPERSE